MRVRVSPEKGFETVLVPARELGGAIAAIAYFDGGLDRVHGAVTVMVHAPGPMVRGIDPIQVAAGGSQLTAAATEAVRALVKHARINEHLCLPGACLTVCVTSHPSATIRAASAAERLQGLKAAHALLREAGHPIPPFPERRRTIP